MKSAMQEWTEWLKAYEYELPLELQIKAKELLEKEKEQIIEAFVECWKANMPDGYECKLSAKEYYNQTYKPETI